MNLTSIHEDMGLIPCLAQGDPELLWLWHRLSAIALILPLAWDLPYAADVALKYIHTYIHTYIHKYINA